MCFVFFRHALQLLTAADSLHPAGLWFWWGESEPTTAAAVLYRMQRRRMGANHMLDTEQSLIFLQKVIYVVYSVYSISVVYSVNCFLQLCLVVIFFSCCIFLRWWFVCFYTKCIFFPHSLLIFIHYILQFFCSIAFNRVLWQYCRCCSIWPGGKPVSPKGLMKCKLPI